VNKAILRDIIRDLREQLADYSAGYTNVVRDRIKVERERDALRQELTTMRNTWRPIPIVHPWEPRDPRCALCDDPRESQKHTPPPPWPGLPTTRSVTFPVSTIRKCTCGTRLSDNVCEARGMACPGDNAMTHVPGCRSTRYHVGRHSWEDQ
jgi:hypothetical protein